MTNKWNIPEAIEKKLKKEIKSCVYCGKAMKEYPHRKGTPGDKATWEHINNRLWRTFIESNTVRCCASCNSSKGNKELCKWLESDYCKKNIINRKRITNAKVRKYLKSCRRKS